MIRRLLGVLLAASVLTACGGPAPTTAPTYGPHNDADVMFAQMMIPHHEQAVQMSDVLLSTDGIDTDVTELATRIKAAQSPEITQMQGWLVAWGEDPSPSPMGGMDHGSDDGMMTDAEMVALDQATGQPAQRLYLRGMIEHHQGAVAMAQAELAHGQSSEAKALAGAIVTSQQAEISEMHGLL